MPPMTSRQRIATAARNQKPDRVPKDISWGFTPAVIETFRKMTGQTDPEDYFNVDIRFIGFDLPPDQQPANEEAVRQRFARYYPQLPTTVYQSASVSEWGTAYVPGEFYHFTTIVPPLKTATNLAQIKAYPLPGFAETSRLEHTRERIAAVHARDLAVGGAMAVTIFEVAWQIRGLEELFEDFVERPEMAECLLDGITGVRLAQARFFAETDVDVLILGDDVSMQTGMLMSPRTWRKWFKGRLQAIIQAARAIRPDIPVFYHSDGNPSAIIPDLIEIGVTVLNPVQPECIDPAWVRRTYGDRLALWGTIGTQSNLPFGTPEQVRQEVRTRIETAGAQGGLILGPTHSLEPDVPWENIVALYAAIEEFGVY